MLRRSLPNGSRAGAPIVTYPSGVYRMATCSLALVAVAGCAATDVTAPATAAPQTLLAAAGASFSSMSTHEHDNREKVVIAGRGLPTRIGQSVLLTATACEPLEHLQKATDSPCGPRWIVDRDASLTWSSTNEAAATVDDNGVVTIVGTGTYAIIAYSDDNGGACTAVGNQPGEVFYEVAWKKDHQHLSEKHRSFSLQCDYGTYRRYDDDTAS